MSKGSEQQRGGGVGWDARNRLLEGHIVELKRVVELVIDVLLSLGLHARELRVKRAEEGQSEPSQGRTSELEERKD